MIIFFTTCIQSCFVFSNYQTAHLIPGGSLSVKPTVSLTNYTLYRGTYTQIFNGGLQFTCGVSKWLNVSTNYTRLYFPDYKVGYNYAILNPTIGIIPDRLAFSMGAGWYFGKDAGGVSSTNLRATILLTFPLLKNLSLTIAPSYIVFIKLPTVPNTIIPISINIRYDLNSLPLSIIPELGGTIMKNDHIPFIFGGIGVEYSILHITGAKND
jgi:hypothetical protein